MVCADDYDSHPYAWVVGADGKPRRECAECGTVHAPETAFAREALRRAVEAGLMDEPPP